MISPTLCVSGHFVTVGLCSRVPLRYADICSHCLRLKALEFGLSSGQATQELGGGVESLKSEGRLLEAFRATEHAQEKSKKRPECSEMESAKPRRPRTSCGNNRSLATVGLSGKHLFGVC